MNKGALQVDTKFEVEEIGISLKELQGAVEGWIEAIDINENLTMWVNEEFLLRSEPNPNLLATSFFATVGGTYAIHGRVAFTGGTSPEGETLPIGAKDKEFITWLAQQLKENEKVSQ